MRERGERAGLESREVRRVWLRLGGDAAAAARELGVSRPTVHWHVARAHRKWPLEAKVSGRLIGGDEEDREALNVYLRLALERAGLRGEP